MHAWLMSLVGVTFVLLAFSLRESSHLVLIVLLLWFALAFFVVGIAYALRRPEWFGKQRSGELSWLPFFTWLPYLLFTRVLHEVQRVLTRESVHDVVANRILVGRRPRVSEIPDDTALVIDMCAELPAARGLTGRFRYLTLPTLDATAPTVEALREGVEAILSTNGPVLIHCAFGHGRSATLAAAAFMQREGITSIEAAEELLRARRRGIRLNDDQRDAIQRYFASRRSDT